MSARPLVHSCSGSDPAPLREKLQTTAPGQFTEASINLPPGVAPDTLEDGDMWTTDDGLFVRINGVTVGPLIDATGASGDYAALTGIPAPIDAIDGLTPAADRLAYYTGASSAALTAFTAFARTLMDDADAATARTTLGAQAQDADLDALAALSGTNTIYYRSGVSTWSAVTIGTGLSFSTGTLSASGGSGTVTTTGSPASGNLAKFSGATSVTNGDLTGDVTTSGTLAATVANINYSAMITATGTPPTNAPGYLGAPQNIVSGNYTTVLTDAGKHFYHTSGSTHTLTIDSNANVAYPIGTVMAGVNENGAGALTLSITSDTLRWGSSTGSRTIAANGSFSVVKVAATVWRLTGDGIT